MNGTLKPNESHTSGLQEYVVINTLPITNLIDLVTSREQLVIQERSSFDLGSLDAIKALYNEYCTTGDIQAFVTRIGDSKTRFARKVPIVKLWLKTPCPLCQGSSFRISLPIRTQGCKQRCLKCSHCEFWMESDGTHPKRVCPCNECIKFRQKTPLQAFYKTVNARYRVRFGGTRKQDLNRSLPYATQQTIKSLLAADQTVAPDEAPANQPMTKLKDLLDDKPKTTFHVRTRIHQVR